jgi:hypothetical protein
LIEDEMISRRGFVARTTGILLLSISNQRLAAAQGYLKGVAGTPITVYKSKSCGCCTKWVDYLGENNFVPTVHDEERMEQIKDALGVPQSLRSCHTATVDKYLIEGHVPAADIRRLLAERPKVAGLAAPGMPAQSPGMAEPGAKPKGYDVLAFQKDGTTQTFARY